MGSTTSSQEKLRKARYSLNAQALERVLLDNGYVCRDDIVGAFDRAGRGAIGLKGIGPVLTKQLREMLAECGQIEWDALLPSIPYTVRTEGEDVTW